MKNTLDATYERKGDGFVVKSKKPRMSVTADTLIGALDGLRSKAAEKLGGAAAFVKIKATDKDTPEWMLVFPPREDEEGALSWRRKYSNGSKGGHVDVRIWFVPPVDGPPSMQNSASGEKYDVVIRIDANNNHLLGGADDFGAAIALADEKATATAQMWGFGGWAHEEATPEVE